MHSENKFGCVVACHFRLCVCFVLSHASEQNLHKYRCSFSSFRIIRSKPNKLGE